MFVTVTEANTEMHSRLLISEQTQDHFNLNFPLWVWRDGSELTALAAFAEDCDSVPSIHLEAHDHL